jgi:hypothetical protein
MIFPMEILNNKPIAGSYFSIVNNLKALFSIYLYGKIDVEDSTFIYVNLTF